MASTDAGDDAVKRIVEAAVTAQTRLLLAYVEQTRETLHREIEGRLRDEFSGDRVYVGKRTAENRLTRNEAIRHDCKPKTEGGGGLSIRAAARKHRLSKSQVAAIVGRVSGVVVTTRTPDAHTAREESR